MTFSPLMDELISALRCLPGIGPKSAQRMAFHLLQRGRCSARQLASTIIDAIDNIHHCAHCRTFSETSICLICANPRRDSTVLCIVESPVDMLALEQAHCFNGLYFVLHGHLSPIDGIGPHEIGIPLLTARLDTLRPTEVILATNPTIEGEATAHYLSSVLQHINIKTTRIAHGVPLGGELEFIDALTLAKSLDNRKTWTN